MFIYLITMLACNPPTESKPILASQITYHGETLDAAIAEIEKRSIEAIAKAEVSINPSKTQKDLEKKIARLEKRIGQIEDKLLDLPEKISDHAQNVSYDPRETTLDGRNVQAALTELAIKIKKIEISLKRNQRDTHQPSQRRNWPQRLN